MFHVGRSPVQARAGPVNNELDISKLRRALESDPSRPRHIITEPGVGYRLI